MNRPSTLTPSPGGAVATSHPAPAAAGPPGTLDALQPKVIWRFLKRQPASFWLINVYLFLEYVRPQSIYTSLAILPWSQLAIIGCCVAVVHERRRLRLPTVLSRLYVLFLGVVLVSSVTAWNPSLSWERIDVPLSWFLIYVLILSIVTTRERYLVFMLGYLLYNLKMSQHGTRSWIGIGFGFRDWGASGAPGWFQNSGEFGIQMCIFLPIVVAFTLALKHRWERWKRWLFWAMPVTAVMSMIASSSRGALIGGLAVLFWMVLQTRHRVRGAIAVAVVVALAWVVLPEEQKARLDTMGDDNTSERRLDLWEHGIEIANQHPVLGIGYNNWGGYYRRYYVGGLSHNIFIEAWAELGYTGLLVFVGMIGGMFYVNYDTRRLARRLPNGRFSFFMGRGLDGALVGLLVAGFFVTVLHYPFFWINAAMTVSLNVVTRNDLARLRKAQALQNPRRGRVLGPA